MDVFDFIEKPKQYCNWYDRKKRKIEPDLEIRRMIRETNELACLNSGLVLLQYSQ